jgi:phage I-like protein
MRLITALLASAFALPAAAGAAQLLPAGTFAARDGRPGPGKSWRLDDAQGARLAADINAVTSQTQIVIDYEHQTLYSQANGQPAPAAGWIESVEWRAGKGLFAKVGWTDAAKARIANGEYRYISPVIRADEDGNVVGLELAALVNHPALLGMEPALAQLAARINHHDNTESSMTLLASLIALLGLPAATTETEITTAIKAQHGELQALKSKPVLPVVPAALATALGVKPDADEPTAVAALAALKGGGDSAATRLAALTTEVATLQGTLLERDLQELLDGALKAHKITPAEVDSLKTIGKKDLAWLRTHLAAKTAIAGLNGQSKSEGHDPGTEGSDQDGADIATRATAWQAEQLKAGITVTTLQAVEHVMAKPAK